MNHSNYNYLTKATKSIQIWRARNITQSDDIFFVSFCENAEGKKCRQNETGRRDQNRIRERLLMKLHIILNNRRNHSIVFFQAIMIEGKIDSELSCLIRWKRWNAVRMNTRIINKFVTLNTDTRVFFLIFNLNECQTKQAETITCDRPFLLMLMLCCCCWRC